MKQLRTILLRLLLAGLAVALVVVGAAILISQTAWFKDMVRERIVAVVEESTGGRVEIGSFNYKWGGLSADLAPFILHGKEVASAAPLFHADKVSIGLKIISVFEKKVDIASVTVDRPMVSIVVNPDGTTNVPEPKIRRISAKPFVQELLDLKIRMVELKNGFAEYNSQRIALDLRAENVDASIRYESAGPRYAGEIGSKVVHWNASYVDDVRFGFESKLALESRRLRVESAILKMKESSVEASGSVDDLVNLKGKLDLKATLMPGELVRPFRVPMGERGSVRFNGRAEFANIPSFEFTIEGNVGGRSLAYRGRQFNVDNVSLTSPLKITRSGLAMRDLRLSALRGEFRGRFDIKDWSRFVVDGDSTGVALEELSSLQKPGLQPLSGTVNGPVHVQGIIGRGTLYDVKADAKLDLKPGENGIPLQGEVAIGYDQKEGVLRLGNSALNLGTSHADVSGTLGEVLAVHLTSRNLNDFLALFRLAGEEPPKQLPVVLKGGTFRFDGTVSGPLGNPHVAGQLDITRCVVKDRDVDHLATTFDLTKSQFDAHSFSVTQGTLNAQGAGKVGLTEWKMEDQSSIDGSLAIRGADFAKLIQETDTKVPITGTISATGMVKGTVGRPQLTGDVQAENIVAYDEHINHARANVMYRQGTVEIAEGHIVAGTGQIDGSGAYTYSGNDWKNGQVGFHISGRGATVAQIHHVRQWREGLNGQVEFKADGAAQIIEGEVRLSTFNGEVNLTNATLDGRSYGNLALTAKTHDNLLDIRAHANVRGTPLEGSGEWRLEGDYPGQGQVVLPHVTVATLHDLLPNTQRPDLPFEGFVEGKIDITGPLVKIDAMKAVVQLTALQINAKPSVQPRAGAQARDLVLRNKGPIVFEATTKTVDVRSARFEGTDSTLDAAGRFSLDSKTPWDLRLNGNIDLKILQIFNPDLLGSGTSTIAAAIRGPFNEPLVEGKLEVKNASLYVTDLPSGLDQANGVILFDRSRATVQTLSAMIGGGTVTVQPGSFVGFRAPAVIYRVQAEARNVRYRSQDGISLTTNASMSLIGTSASSVLSGTVTVMRAGFSPRTDVGSLLAAAAKPISTPTTPNEYLRGVQFDVRVETAQGLGVETSLTKNIEAEANLRIRGNPERPVVLGNLSVNAGEIEFFGTKYAINRGEVNFYNPAKIEPIIDMDLETHVRGITVDILFAGPLNKLNFSYRSDPPLETTQILALLAVGREPVAAGGLASAQTNTNTSYLATGTNALLSQAISAPASGRLQRLFGVSHIKIDPQFTDLTSIPQARVTLEQQISKDITMTYITNLARTQEQIIRVEWDFNRQWSAIAIRDENGLFGIDFQYRKRFK